MSTIFSDYIMQHTKYKLIPLAGSLPAHHASDGAAYEYWLGRWARRLAELIEVWLDIVEIIPGPMLSSFFLLLHPKQKIFEKRFLLG